MGMIIELKNVSKRYTDEWILKNVKFKFTDNKIYGIKGPNGSGKSTLLKLISGYLSPSMGDIIYAGSDDSRISRDLIYRKCSLWGPHVTLLNHLEVNELIRYYFTFKKLNSNYRLESFLQSIDLKVNGKQRVSALSSGQAQRLGLGLSILADTPLLLLDEPSSYLDEEAEKWLYELIENHASERIVIISSNESKDLELASTYLDIMDFK